MQIKRPILCMLALAALTLFFLVDVSEAFARGPGGGGRGGGRGGPGGARGRAGFGRAKARMHHHHRRGPASRGNFYSRPKHRSGMRRPPRSASYDRRPYSRRTPSRPTTRPPARPIQPVPPPDTLSQEQLEKRAEMREKRARRREKQREDRREEWRRRRHRDEIGTTYSSDYWDDDYDDYWDDGSCEAEVVVDGVTYFQCEGVWYRRAYAGGQVSYVVVEGPRGE